MLEEKPNSDDCKECFKKLIKRRNEQLSKRRLPEYQLETKIQDETVERAAATEALMRKKWRDLP